MKPRAAKVLQKKLKGARKVEEKAKKERLKRVAKAKKEYEAQKRMDAAEKAAEQAVRRRAICSTIRRVIDPSVEHQARDSRLLRVG